MAPNAVLAAPTPLRALGRLALLAALLLLLTLSVGAGTSAGAPTHALPLPTAPASGESRAGPRGSCTNCYVGNVSVPFDPTAIAFDSANGYLYVPDGGANLSIINGANDQVVDQIGVGVPYEDVPRDVAVDTGTNEVYLPDDTNDNVTVVNAATDATSSIKVREYPYSDVYDPTTGDIYVSALGDLYAFVSVIDGASNTVSATIHLGDNVALNPIGLAVDPATGILYAGNGLAANVTVVNVGTDATVGSINVGSDPDSIAFDPANDLLYVADTAGTNVTVVNSTTNAPQASISLSSILQDWGPSAVAYDAATGCVYAASQGADTVAVIDTYNGAVIDTIPVPGGPNAVAVDSATGQVYVTYTNDAQTESYVGYLNVGTCPYGEVLTSVSVAPDLNYIFTDDGTATETATLTCAPGACPGTVAFAWTLTNSIATLSSATTNPTNVVAGVKSGSVSVFLNVTLNGITMEANEVSVILSVPAGSSQTLTAATITPSTGSVGWNGTATFTAQTTCSPSPCGAGVTYAWSLSSATLGTLNVTGGTVVLFTAKAASGTEDVNLTVTLNGGSQHGQAVVTITKTSSGGSGSSGSSGGLLGLPGDAGVAVVGGIMAAAVVAVVLVLFLKKRKSAPAAVAAAPSPPPTYAPSPAPPSTWPEGTPPPPPPPGYGTPSGAPPAPPPPPPPPPPSG